jgi:2-(1,2-epoxy-1,2-dihydrophenyl)acetyl-CoA isomerase
MRTDFQNVLVEHDESVVTLTMNRPDVLNAIKVSDQLAKYHRLIRAIRHMPKPVIAAMQGIATGITVNIALACDIRIAADNARLREGFALIGLVPDGGGGYHLPRLVGMGRA